MSDSFTVVSVRVGINLDHTYPGDLSATLKSPSNTQIQLIASSGDFSANFDVLLDSASGSPLDDGSDDDISTPFYDRSAAPASPLTVYTGQNASDIWTLNICDTSSSDDGTLRQWSLFFTAVAPPAAPVVTITKSGSDVRLTWPHVKKDTLGNDVTVTSYEVWRSTKPYFTPGPGDPAIVRLPDVLPPFGSTVTTTDSGVLTAGVSYTYVVRAVAGSAVSASSKRVGAFVFGIVPGG